ncbi:acyltransferase family protein [Parabacteroides johnsonii]|uniref:acyltransferase family protein n=1 Tax=Parabacteroides johnsonii TaxID=387661 RepID=UPI003AB43BB7
MRDRNLDIYRGGIMIYITCFCHLMWWEGVNVGIFERGWVSGIFFAMVTVFYLVGASYSLSSKKTYWEYVKGRVKRVVIPYWKYALCCLPAVLYIYWKHGLIISLDGVVSYVFFNPPVENRIFDHIWFISPYILISLCLPFCASFIRRYKPPFVFWGIVLILSQLFKSYYPDLLQTVVIYLFFTIWGLYYTKRLGWQNVVCVVVAVGYVVYAFGIEKRPFDLQANKFPPNLLFLAYGLTILGIGGSYMKKGLVLLYDKFRIVRYYIDIYSKEGYEIYLVHAFSTLLLGGFKRALGLNQIIAEHLSLQLIYIVIGFLFLLNVNIYILRLYNYIWSLIDRIFRTVFPIWKL